MSVKLAKVPLCLATTVSIDRHAANMMVLVPMQRYDSFSSLFLKVNFVVKITESALYLNDTTLPISCQFH